MSDSQAQRSILSRVFISDDIRRLRSGWRLLIHTILMVFLLIFFSLPIMVLTLIGGMENTITEPLFYAVNACAVILSVWIARKFLDQKSFRSLGLHHDQFVLQDIVVGFMIPAVLMGAILGFFFLMGWVDWEGWAFQNDSAVQLVLGVSGGFIIYILVGFYEEILSRGYQLQNIAEGLNLPLGVLLSSAIFGLLHVFNPSASMISTLGIFAAGVFLAYGWIRTKQLWLPIGLHIGWNFFEGTIFGFPVSGTASYRLMLHSIKGPSIITGGAFGPEAGLIVLPAMIIGAVFIHAYTRDRNKDADTDPLPK